MKIMFIIMFLVLLCIGSIYIYLNNEDNKIIHILRMNFIEKVYIPLNNYLGRNEEL